MKKMTALASIVGAGAAAVAAIAWFNRGKEDKIHYVSDVPDGAEVPLPGTEAEDDGHPQRVTGGLTSEKLFVQLPEVNRSVELHPNGKLYYYEDGKVIQEESLSNCWPEGKYKIHYYKPYSGTTAWLFFEKLDDNAGDGYFCEEQFEEGFTKMDHVVALDGSLHPLGLSYAKDARAWDKRFSIYDEKIPALGGKKVTVHVPQDLRCGDEQRTIDGITYFGEEDGRYYGFMIGQDSRATILATPANNWESYDSVGYSLVVDRGDYYLVVWVSKLDANSIELCFKDTFGEHDFDRFLRACKVYPDDPSRGLSSVFYKQK